MSRIHPRANLTSNSAAPRRVRRRPIHTFALVAAAWALCAGLAAIVAGLGSRFGLWTYGAGLLILAAAASIGGVAALASLFAGAWAWHLRARRALAVSLLGVAAGALTLGVPLAFVYQARNAPPIHDITTDPANPPQFVALRAAREASPNGAAYGGAAIAEAQRRAYPDIRPLHYPARPQVAFERCLTAARELGWKIAGADPRALRIEATATTLFFGLKDDVVVRITPHGPASIIDVRSDARVGRGDFGTNARRIRALFRELARQG